MDVRTSVKIHQVATSVGVELGSLLVQTDMNVKVIYLHMAYYVMHIIIVYISNNVPHQWSYKSSRKY